MSQEQLAHHNDLHRTACVSDQNQAAPTDWCRSRCCCVNFPYQVILLKWLRDSHSRSSCHQKLAKLARTPCSYRRIHRELPSAHQFAALSECEWLAVASTFGGEIGPMAVVAEVQGLAEAPVQQEATARIAARHAVHRCGFVGSKTSAVGDCMGAQQVPLQGAGAASNSLLLKASTNHGAVGFRSPHDMQRFLNAAICGCSIDSTFVLDCLGSQEKEGLCRLKEICSVPFSIQVAVVQHNFQARQCFAFADA